MQPITAQTSAQAPSAPGRPVPPRGRWVWRLTGILVVLGSTALVSLAIVKAGTDDYQGGFAQSALPTRTVIVPQAITSVNVTSYGAPIQVTTGPGSETTVTEMISFDEKIGPPRVTEHVSRGALTLAAPACENRPCSVGFAVTVPAGVTVMASSDGAPVTVSGAAAADINSGGGTVAASNIKGLLTVAAGGGDITVTGAGSASLDSGSGAVSVSGVPGPLTVSAEGGEIDAHAIGSATLDSGSGPVNASGAAGALTVNSAGGSINVSVTQGASLDSGSGQVVARAIDGPLNVTTEGGSLQVDGLTGPLFADTGSGPLNAGGLKSPTARVSTAGGSAWLDFTTAPQSVQVTTGSGNAVLVLPGGPYAVSAQSLGGPVDVSVPVSMTAASTISVSTQGGELQVKPPTG
jgi:hypothetical protein